MRATDILDIKGREVVTVSPDAALHTAIETLAARNIGAVVVLGEGRIVGILSERDVVRLLAGAPTGFRENRIDSLMTKDPVTIEEGATIEEIEAVMTERRIRHLPVAHAGRLVGILSIGDVVKHRIEAAREEAEALKGYIQG